MIRQIIQIEPQECVAFHQAFIEAAGHLVVQALADHAETQDRESTLIGVGQIRPRIPFRISNRGWIDSRIKTSVAFVGFNISRSMRR